MPLTTRFLVDFFHPQGQRQQRRRKQDARAPGRAYAEDTVDDPLMPAPPAPIIRDNQRRSPRRSPRGSSPPSYYSFEDQGIYPTLRRMVTFRGPHRNNPVRRGPRDADLAEGGSVAPGPSTKPEDVTSAEASAPKGSDAAE